MTLIDDLKFFKITGYIKLLKHLMKKYKIVPFCEVEHTKSPFLILRHDIDASLEAAVKMAELENSLQIRSTFFVLFSYKLYNILEEDDFAKLKKISRLGHEIGLHYDIKAYETYSRNLKKTLLKEIELLEHILNRRVYSIAPHNVSIAGKGPLTSADGYINAYAPELCKNYVSDSCRAWYLGSLYDLMSFKHQTAQLLIHPIIWTEDICSRNAVLERLFQETERKNREYLLKWLELYDNPKVRNYDNLINGRNPHTPSEI